MKQCDLSPHSRWTMLVRSLFSMFTITVVAGMISIPLFIALGIWLLGRSVISELVAEVRS